MSKPLLWLFLIFGRIPYYVETGWMKVKIRSTRFLYSMACVGVSLYLQILYLDFYILYWKIMQTDINFEQIIFTSILLLQVIGTATTMYSWFFEAPDIVKNYNNSAELETRFVTLCPDGKIRRWVVNLIAGIFGVYFVLSTAICCFLLLDEFDYSIPFPIVVTCTANFLITQGHGVMWCMNFLFIRHLASQLLKNVKKVEEGRSCFKLKVFKRLWIQIWRLSVNYGNCQTLSLLTSFLLYGIVFITANYGIVVTISSNKELEKLLPLLGYLFLTLTYMFGIFEVAHQAKTKLHDEFMYFMVSVNREKLDFDSSKEVERFLELLLQTNAMVSLKGFFSVGRPLLVSFLSSSTTYLIVLLQVAKS